MWNNRERGGEISAEKAEKKNVTYVEVVWKAVGLFFYIWHKIFLKASWSK